MPSTAERIIPGRGSKTPDIVFVNPCPDKLDDEQNMTMAGNTGRILAQLCTEAGIDLETVYVTNAVPVKPPSPRRNPTPTEVREWKEHLLAELVELNPKVIVTLGAPPLLSLYKNTPVKAVAGFSLYNEEVELAHIPIIPTYAPGFLMTNSGKNWGMAAVVIAHLKKAQRIVAQEETQGFGSYTGITTLENLRALRDLVLDSEFVSVDSETTGLSWMDDEILCISFAPEAGVGYSVPILHRGTATTLKDKRMTKTRANELLRCKKETPTEQEWAWLDTVPPLDEEDWEDTPRIIKEAVETWAAVPFWDLKTEMPEVIEILREMLGSDVPKWGQNIGFDQRFFERSTDEEVVTASTAFGFKLNNVQHCTKMLSRLLQENLPANLTTMNAFYTDIPYYEENIKPFISRMWEVPDEETWVYGAIDTDVVARLVPDLHGRVVAHEVDWVYNNLSMPLIQCAQRMEQRGIAIDLDYFDRLCLYFGEELEKACGELDQLVGRHVDKPTYYETLQNLLFVEYKLPLTHKPVDSAVKGDNRCGKCQRDKPCSPQHASTNGDELAALHERHPHDILPIVIKIKKLDKFKGTYLDGGRGGFRRHIRSDGRIHGRWNPGDAETGRYTSQDPNLMNPAKDVEVDSDKYNIHTKDAIRDMFTCRPGNVLMNADWAQLEVWTLAYTTQDETLLNLLTSGEDVHVYVARKLCELGVSAVFPAVDWQPELDNYEWGQVHGDLRDRAKTFVFGLSYQLTVEGAALRLGCTVDEAQLLFDAFLNDIFPSLPGFFANVRQEMLRTNGVRNMFGRMRHFDEIPILQALGFSNDLEACIRQGVNFPIQSGGHDLHSLVAIRHETDPVLVSRCEVVLEMHDSLAMEAKAATALETAWIVKNSWEDTAKNTIMPNGEKLGWEIPVDVEWGRTFGTPDWKLTARGQLIDKRKVA